MAQNYPDTEAFAYSFSRCEIALDGRIYTAITSISIDQPTEEGEVKGTRPAPIARTQGTMSLGEGSVTFSDDRERLDFIDALGDAYREKIWTASYVMRGSKAGSERKIECFGCRVLSNPFEHEEGADALGGDIGFSFMSHKINGKSPHS